MAVSVTHSQPHKWQSQSVTNILTSGSLSQSLTASQVAVSVSHSQPHKWQSQSVTHRLTSGSLSQSLTSSQVAVSVSHSQPHKWQSQSLTHSLTSGSLSQSLTASQVAVSVTHSQPHKWQSQSLTHSLTTTDGDYITTTPGRSHRHCIEVSSIRFIPDFAIPSSSSSIYWTGLFQGVKSPIEACALGGGGSVCSL